MSSHLGSASPESIVADRRRRRRASRAAVALFPVAVIVVVSSCDGSTSADQASPTGGDSAVAVAEQFIAALNDRDARAATSLVWSGAPIAVSPLSPGEALDKDVTVDEQIGWLAAWDWRWDEVTCTATEGPPTSFDLVEEGVDRGVVVEFDTSVACKVVAHTKLGDVDDASVGHTIQLHLLDDDIAYVRWGAPQLRWMPSFLDFKDWAETERSEPWGRAWDDDGPILTEQSTEVEGQILEEYIALGGTGGPATTSPPVTATASEARLAGLPASDPVTIALRPGALWPLLDPIYAWNLGVTGLSADEEEHDGVTTRTVTYVSSSCDVERRDGAECDPTVIVTASFADAPSQPPETGSTIPLTPNGDVWVQESSDPDAYPQCLDDSSPPCRGNVNLETRVDGVPVSIAVPRAIAALGSDMEERMTDRPGSYVELARSVGLADEVSGPVSGPFLEFDPAHTPSRLVPWFRGTLFGPVVAATDDGEHELRAQSNGDDIALYASSQETMFPSSGFGSAPEDSPVRLDYHRTGGDDPVLFGIAEPEVFEIRFESMCCGQPRAVEPFERYSVATDDRSNTFRSQFFIAVLPWRWSPTGRWPLRVTALDADGNEMACFDVSAWGGIGAVDGPCDVSYPEPTADADDGGISGP